MLISWFIFVLLQQPRPDCFVLDALYDQKEGGTWLSNDLTVWKKIMSIWHFSHERIWAFSFQCNRRALPRFYFLKIWSPRLSTQWTQRNNILLGLDFIQKKFLYFKAFFSVRVLHFEIIGYFFDTFVEMMRLVPAIISFSKEIIRNSFCWFAISPIIRLL